MSPRTTLLIATSAWSTLSAGCFAVVPWRSRDGRSGTLVTAEGAPIPHADVDVNTWSIEVPGQKRVELTHTFATKTDDQGRFTVPGGTSLVATIFGVPEAPSFQNEYRFRPPQQEPLVVLEIRDDTTHAGADMRVAFDSRPPLTIFPVPVFGIAVGGGQVFSGHFGPAFLFGRRHLAAGPRAEAQVGGLGFGGSLGLAVLVCCRSTIPLPAFELNARILRPWTVDDRHSTEFGPELAIDTLSLRFALAFLGEGVGAPLGDRRFVFSVGFGYL